jgi:UDP-N-acetylmuramate dehydrogenase
MIEQSGFPKGYKEGNTGLSEKHALVVVNKGGATTKDIITLIDKISKSVHLKFGVKLQPEVISVE